jgi:hypothetical protein
MKGVIVMNEREASRLALGDVTEAAFGGVLRALEIRRIPMERIPGPILVGIIWWPELRQGGMIGKQGLPGGEIEADAG